MYIMEIYEMIELIMNLIPENFLLEFIRDGVLDNIKKLETIAKSDLIIDISYFRSNDDFIREKYKSYVADALKAKNEELNTKNKDNDNIIQNADKTHNNLPSKDITNVYNELMDEKDKTSEIFNNLKAEKSSLKKISNASMQSRNSSVNKGKIAEKETSNKNNDKKTEAKQILESIEPHSSLDNSESFPEEDEEMEEEFDEDDEDMEIFDEDKQYNEFYVEELEAESVESEDRSSSLKKEEECNIINMKIENDPDLNAEKEKNINELNKDKKVSNHNKISFPAKIECDTKKSYIKNKKSEQNESKEINEINNKKESETTNLIVTKQKEAVDDKKKSHKMIDFSEESEENEDMEKNEEEQDEESASKEYINFSHNKSLYRNSLKTKLISLSGLHNYKNNVENKQIKIEDIIHFIV